MNRLKPFNRLLLVLALLAAGALAPATLAAQDGGGEHLLSEATYNALNQINEMLQEGRYSDALTRLRRLEQDIDADEDYERAVLRQTFGYAYNGLERYGLAAESFIEAVESEALPADVSHRLKYYIAQLLTQDQQYREAIRYLESWFADEDKPGAEARRLAAGIYYEIGDHAGVIRHARAAIAASDRADENLYQLLLAAYFETKAYNEAADLLERMLELFPDNPDYWKQLASVYQSQNEDRKALAVTELAYRQGQLNRREKLNLGRLYLHLQAPQRAARFLQQAIDNGEIDASAENMKLLADSYYLAREVNNAIDAYGRAAAAAGDAELYLRQGQLLVQRQRWDEARNALRQALDNAGLEDDQRATANLLLGMAAYQLEDNTLAREALNRAAASSNTQRSAEYWLEQLERRS